MTSSTQQRRRVVIVGAGFGGLSAAKRFANSPFDVTVVDRHNYHLFQPLLYQVATAGLSPADIASPIRGILGRQRNAEVLLAKVSGVDLSNKEVVAEGTAFLSTISSSRPVPNTPISVMIGHPMRPD
jgi:NADH:ubiquinone reductase (H+-translocating)